MKAQRHPRVSAIAGIMAGAMIAPTFVPALKMAVAKARSFFGNHSATALIGRGEVAALAHAQEHPGGEEAVHGADERVAHRGDAPQDDGGRVADLRPEAVHEPAEQEQAHRVGELEGPVHPAEGLVRPAELRVEELLDQGEDLAVDVVDGGGEEEQRADHPAVLAGSCEAHWFTPLARKPPSTAITWPLTKLAASEARKMHRPTSSSTWPKRLSGVRMRSSLPRSVPSRSAR